MLTLLESSCLLLSEAWVLKVLVCYFQRHGCTVSQPNEFEVSHRPSIIQHLPPLSAREVSSVVITVLNDYFLNSILIISYRMVGNRYLSQQSFLPLLLDGQLWTLDGNKCFVCNVPYVVRGQKNQHGVCLKLPSFLKVN